MLPNAFIGKAEQPTEKELAAVLGSTKAIWDQLLMDLAKDFGANIQEWKCYSRKFGWSLRVKRKARTIVWLGPSGGAFTVAFILGDKAVRAAQESGLPPSVIQMINEAKKYLEGRGVRLVPKTSKDLDTIRELAAIKLAN